MMRKLILLVLFSALFTCRSFSQQAVSVSEETEISAPIAFEAGKYGSQPVMINFMDITGQSAGSGVISLSGLPPGLSYIQSEGNENKFIISGIPAMEGSFEVFAILTYVSSDGSDVQVLGNNVTPAFRLDVDPVQQLQESTGKGFIMEQNIPNPCNDNTNIRFAMPEQGEVDFRIYNLIGKEVYRSLINADQGENEFKLDTRDFSPGVYMYTMTFNGESVSKRMVISRK